MKLPDFKPFNLALKINSLTIATTRKKILPSLYRKSGGAIFTISSVDSCTKIDKISTNLALKSM